MNTPLRIGLIVQGGQHWMGGTEYVKNLVLALASLPSDVRSTFEVSLVCSQELAAVRSELAAHVKSTYSFSSSPEPVTARNLVRWGVSRALFGQGDLRLVRALDPARPDFVYPFFHTLRGRRRFRSAAWVPDCQHKYLTRFFTDDELESRDRWFSSVAERAPVVVLSSRNAEADFRKYFHPRHRCEVLSFRVCPLPEWYDADPRRVQEAYGLPDRFFLVSNQFWQHKNHAVVFQAIEALRGRGIRPAVVCTGSLYDYRRPSFLDETLQQVHRLGIADQVHLLGVVNRLDMIGLMRRSLAVVQPSLFEGWSTVVEEARCLGKRIILSDLPVHREQEPPDATFFDPNAPGDLAITMADYWNGLAPGPDAEREAAARSASLSDVQAFGRRFLEIAMG